jgi:hypothetical protein
MPNVWLYHINPKSPYGYNYGWKTERPETILKSKDRVWSSGNRFNQVAVGDVICVFMKNIGKRVDGVYIVGNVTSISPENAEFSWRPDPQRSARTLLSPIGVEDIRKFFPRSYGESIQPLEPGRRRAWLELIGVGEVTDGVPRLKARTLPQSTPPPLADPKVSKEHGQIGELHVLAILRERHKSKPNRKVIHLSAKDPGADHDIEVWEDGVPISFVEVKTRVGKPGDPVIISEREIACRRANRKRHSIFVVYLGLKSRIRGVLEIDSVGAFQLKPRQHWLFPGTS